MITCRYETKDSYEKIPIRAPNGMGCPMEWDGTGWDETRFLIIKISWDGMGSVSFTHGIGWDQLVLPIGIGWDQLALPMGSDGIS